SSRSCASSGVRDDSPKPQGSPSPLSIGQSRIRVLAARMSARNCCERALLSASITSTGRRGPSVEMVFPAPLAKPTATDRMIGMITRLSQMLRSLNRIRSSFRAISITARMATPSDIHAAVENCPAAYKENRANHQQDGKIQPDVALFERELAEGVRRPIHNRQAAERRENRNLLHADEHAAEQAHHHRDNAADHIALIWRLPQ